MLHADPCCYCPAGQLEGTPLHHWHEGLVLHASCSTITDAAALQVSIRAPLFTISTQGLAAPDQQPLELKLSHHNLVVSGGRQGSAGSGAATEGPLYRLTVATTGAVIRLGLPGSQAGCAFDCGGAALEAEVSRGMRGSSASETVPAPPEACREVGAVTGLCACWVLVALPAGLTEG